MAEVVPNVVHVLVILLALSIPLSLLDGKSLLPTTVLDAVILGGNLTGTSSGVRLLQARCSHGTPR